MTRKNRFVHHAHISEGKFRALLRAFAVDLTATQIAVLTGLNRNTVNGYLTKIRRRIAEPCEQSSPFAGAVEVDEIFFGTRRMKGKRGPILLPVKVSPTSPPYHRGTLVQEGRRKLFGKGL